MLGFMIPDAQPSGKRVVWARFRRVVWGVTAAGLFVAVMVLVYLRFAGAPMPWHARAAIGLGVTLSFAVGGVLMGLLFASNRSGHDSAADQRLED